MLLAATPAGAQSVLGRVTDAATGEPVASVRVVLVTTGGEQAGQVVSDADGMFHIVAAPGEFRLRTSHIGYRDVTTDAFVTRPDEVAQRRFSLVSTNVGSAEIAMISNGWGLGLTTGYERRIADRLAAHVSIGQDRVSFGPYDKLDRAPARTGATWLATAIRLGLVFDVTL